MLYDGMTDYDITGSDRGMVLGNAKLHARLLGLSFLLRILVWPFGLMRDITALLFL